MRQGHRATLVAAGLTGAGILCLSAATWLDAIAGPPYAHGVLDMTWNWAAVLATALLGIRVVQRRPEHPVGWILSAMAFVGGATALAEMWGYAGLVWRPGRYPGAAAADVASYASWLMAFAGLAYLLLYFPDGRLPGPRWRKIPYLLAIALAGAYFGATVQPGRQNDPFQTIDNPAGIAWFGGAGELVVGAFMLATFGCLIACATSVVIRYRRAVDEERAQIAWLAYAVILLPVALLGCAIGLAATGTDAVGEVVLPLALVIVPATIGAAVLRYRLYDIEYLINRTVVYAAVSGVLFGLFVLMSLAVGVAVGRRSPWAIAAATLTAALAARPVRNAVQRVVNRRFDRATAAGLAVIDDFLAALRDERAHAGDVEAALAEALHDPGLRVWLWLREEASFADVNGRICRSLKPTATTTVDEVVKNDAPLAAIERRADLDHRPRLLRSVLHRARLGLELARLAAESAHQLAELETSRARIVEATFEERRRLERDLHDGAQQRLVALGVRIRRLQRAMPPEARVLGPALDQTVDEVASAIADLRRLAAGLRPARLDDGLTAALEDLARSTPIPIDLTVDVGRAPTTVETAAYFVACEGVTNAVKHSGATRITVDAAHSKRSLHIRVSDDGVGGAFARDGAGLAGLTDRVQALGGRLVVTSAPGEGTTIEADLPCA